jgi:hypothetical protein
MVERRMAETNQPNRTVIMLGAGASAGSMHTLPVMEGFFDTDGDSPMSEQLVDGLHRIYGDVDVCGINVEDVFAYLDMATHYRQYADSATHVDTAHLEALRIEVEAYVAKRLRIAEPEMTMPGHPRQEFYIAPTRRTRSTTRSS